MKVKNPEVQTTNPILLYLVSDIREISLFYPVKYVSFLSWFYPFCATIPGIYLMDLPSLALWDLQHKSDVAFIILWKGLTELLIFPGTFTSHNFLTSKTLLSHRGKFLSLLNYVFIMTLKSEPCRKLSCFQGSSWDRD